MDESALNLIVGEQYYANLYEVDFFKTEAANQGAAGFGKLNAAQRADYLFVPSGN